MIAKIIDWLSFFWEPVAFDRELLFSEKLAEVREQMYQRLASEFGSYRFPLASVRDSNEIALIVEAETGCCKTVRIPKHHTIRRRLNNHECTSNYYIN